MTRRPNKHQHQWESAGGDCMWRIQTEVFFFFTLSAHLTSLGAAAALTDDLSFRWRQLQLSWSQRWAVVWFQLSSKGECFFGIFKYRVNCCILFWERKGREDNNFFRESIKNCRLPVAFNLLIVMISVVGFVCLFWDNFSFLTFLFFVLEGFYCK